MAGRSRRYSDELQNFNSTPCSLDNDKPWTSTLDTDHMPERADDVYESEASETRPLNETRTENDTETAHKVPTTKSASKKAKGMTYEVVLTSLGEFGRYQQRVFIMVGWATVAVSLQMFLSIFTLAVPKHRCAIPHMANDTWQIQSDLHALLVNVSIPPGDLDTYSSCLIYADASRHHGNWSHLGSGYDLKSPNETSLWPGSEDVGGGDNNYSLLNKENGTTSCDRYVYDTSLYTSSMTTELNLVCERNLYRSHAQMMLMMGCLLGSQLSGLVSDVWGRKIALMTSLVSNVLVVLAMAFVQSYVLLLMLMFLTGVTLLGIFSVSFVLSLELVGPSKRLWPGIGYAVFFALGMMLLSLVAYFLRDWQHLQLVCAALTVPHLFFWWFIPESPRWLLSKGRADDAKVILNRMARVNKVTLTLDVLDKLEVKTDMPLWKICISTRKLVGRHLIIFFSWMVASMTYYGLSLNAGTLGGSVYVNVVLMGLMDIAALVVCLLLLDRAGRRVLGAVWYLVAGVACTATLFPVLFASQDKQWISVMLALIGKFGIAGAFAVIWIFASELFPTVMRNSAMGASSVCGRIGGIIAPYIANMDAGGSGSKAIPLVIFGVPAIVVCVLLLCLPETLKRRLPETVQDAVDMGRKKKKAKRAEV
ncbi:organic cation transporter protein-like isoform X2 [Littorina saxatilis]|uniref:Major facilitator superfamily (MFS) profile domain-containing protein n=1 Tax=Littorina saxatilis TaxID=31220 RepID=A0AAN9B1H9_9CAEN